MRPGGLEVVAHTTVVLVRHGQAERGTTDPGLSARGREEANAVAKALAGEPVEAVYCSPQRRALETAAPLCAELGLRAQVRDGLAEFDRRSTEYVLLSELRAAGDPRFDACMAGDLTPWGIDLPTFRAEAGEVLAEILTTHAGGRALVVSHGGVLNVLLGAAVGIDRMWFFHPDNCGINRLVADTSGGVRLASLNETQHLPPPLVTKG
ncbi:histidine phosphatase family protein [Sporichthya polymorpha]|uniref:histidine phosphatase family protein n=1 Tax=Sporichthya polymorpha TaxID=35751 RepID=UPI000363C182|nr:histidine phosphatase family protein [Sporichthya polymorpha]